MNVSSPRRCVPLLLAVPVLAARMACRPASRSRSAAPAATIPQDAPSAAALEPSRIVVLTLTSRVFGNTRSIRVYLPPGYFAAASSRRRYPVFYFNDGFAVFSARLWNALEIADSLIAAGRVAPVRNRVLNAHRPPRPSRCRLMKSPQWDASRESVQ